ncbi:MAG: carbohydrate binding family 9 domain-containing protein [Bacteroidetes bacterium]|nr:carbohydrate binding family 9 domain-containing protein [Bacteroidota bacterium]
MKQLLLLFFLNVLLLQLSAQDKEIESIQKNYQLKIQRTSEKIKIDGELNETTWQKAELAKSFWRKFPTDGGKAKRQTDVRISFDNIFLYVAFTAYDSGEVVIQSLKRDVGHDGQDGVALVLDPVNRRTNGFFFVVNAFNAQSEDLITVSGDGPNWSWDNKWYSATKRENGKWYAEMAIPFKTLRYTADNQQWGINFLRIDTKSNEYSCWTPVPVNFRSYDLGYTGSLIWDEKPPQPGSNISVIPYITGNANENKQTGQPWKSGGNAGFDSKIALNSSLNLDITVNPDFSQIEVDRQVTNLTRFNIFFPERRTFFLENDDLFSGFGIPPIRPFYSRKIGLDQNINAIPILFGARLSGNLNKRSRIGLMNMQTGKTSNYAAENYTAAVFNQQVLKRSSIKAMFLNRQSFLTDDQKKADPLLEYGRNGGVEFSYSDLSGKWNGWTSHHKSFKPGIHDKNSYSNIGGGYFGRKFSSFVDFVSLGTNYYTDMGFLKRIENYDALQDTVIRLGYKHFYNETEFTMFPKKGSINTHRYSLNTFIVWNPDGSLNEQSHVLRYSLDFKNTSSIFLMANNTLTNLLFPTSFTGGTPLPADQYRYSQYLLEYTSDFRKTFRYTLSAGTGDFYNGTNTQLSASITYRNQPHVNITLRAEYYRLSFPGSYGSTELLLIAPRVEINFATNLFWTTFIQYNNQRNNFNINSRLQWRYKPMSDFFLVYTDNYFTDPLFKNRNRAIVFKLNYWLNL